MIHLIVEGGVLLGGGSAPSRLKGPAHEEFPTCWMASSWGRGLGWGVELISIWFRRCSRFNHGLHTIGLNVYLLLF
jgi:hypothetical protein